MTTLVHPAGCSCSDSYYHCGDNWRNCQRTAALFATPGIEFTDETLKKIFHVYGGYPFVRMNCMMRAMRDAGLLDERARGLCFRLIGLLDERALDRKARLVEQLGALAA